ncbi:hypothetical protein [Klebsiella sp. BIGb0407]|uniref:hypothetical protein n=1 Tax=Klebsiella sp. BIGb0407 TaxID=2940603 RepID=UPI0021675985|nr:hypothetical protein [Klebsiella sp. BIGb0407]MCS3431623.1 hypothetical protein [Klebsiella sp. BIGb0407]
MNPHNSYPGAQPDAEIFDVTDWPIVFIRFPQLGMPDRTPRLLNGLSEFLTQQQRVVFVWIPARHGHDREPHEEEKQSTRWMKQYKNELRDWCAGYVYMTSDPEVRTSLSTLFPKLKKIMPFPKTLADDREDACAKAREFLANPAT